MSDFVLSCPTVPVLHDSEVRFSLETKKVRRIFDWPIAHVACGEITPHQLRLQWNRPLNSARYDSFSGLRFGDDDNNLTLGARTTYVSSDSALAPVENQRVGVASLTVGGLVRFKYWNDHAFWWWPMGDGGDQGDTAGLQFSYNLSAHRLSLQRWKFEDLSLTMRLATGIPDRSSAVPMGDGQVYARVQFPEVDRGDLNLNATLTRPAQAGSKPLRLDVGVTVNCGGLRYGVQSKAVHDTLGIPRLPRTDHLEFMMYLRLANW